MPDITKNDYQSWKKRKKQQEAIKNQRRTITPLVKKPSAAERKTTNTPGVTDPTTGFKYTPVYSRKPSEQNSDSDVIGRILQKHIIDTANRRATREPYKRGDLGSIDADLANNRAYLDTVRQMRELYGKNDAVLDDFLADAEKYGVEYDFELTTIREENLPFGPLFKRWGSVPEAERSGYYSDGGIQDTLNGLYDDLRNERDPAKRKVIQEQIEWYDRYNADMRSSRTAEMEATQQDAMANAAMERYYRAASQASEVERDIEGMWASPSESLDDASARIMQATADSNYSDYRDTMSQAKREAEEAESNADAARRDAYHLALDEQYGFTDIENEIAATGGMTEEQLESFKLNAANDNSFNRLANRQLNSRYAYNGVEAATYQYLLVNEGQDAASAYADFIRDRVERRANEEASQFYYELGDYSDAETGIGKAAQAVGASALALTSNIVQAVHSADIVAQNIHRAATGSNEPVHYYSTSQFTEAASQPREAVAENLSQVGNLSDLIGKAIPIIGEMTLGDLYNAGMDGLNALINRGAFGHLQGVMMGAQAAAPAFDEAHELGGSDRDSLFYGLSSGANEMIGETLGYESFLKLGQEHGLFNSTLGKILLGCLLQPGNEAVEEGVTEILNQLSDKFWLESDSKYNQIIKDYEAVGYSYDEAQTYADEQLREQVIKAALQGVLGSFISTGGYYTGIAVEKAAAKAEEKRFNSMIAEIENQTAAEAQDDTAAAPTSRAGAVRPPEGTVEATKAKADERIASMKTAEGDSSMVGDKPVKVHAITKTGDDATVRVTDESGAESEVKLSDVAVGKGTRSEVYAYAADMATPELANTFRGIYKPGQNIETVANATSFVYEMAEGGMSEASLRKSSVTTVLDDEQFQTVYKLAKDTRVANIARADEKATERLKNLMGNSWRGGTLKMGEVVEAALSGKQREDVELVRVLAGISGMNVELFQSTANAEGRFTRENGSYNRATNTIYLDVNAGRDYAGDSMAKTALLRTMSHEMTHATQANSPAIYGRLQEAVLETLSSQGVDIEDRIARVMTRDSSVKTRAAALDEIVADACETMLRDSEAAQRFKEAHPEQARTLGQKIREFLDRLTDAIKKAFAGDAGAKSEEAKALTKDVEALKKIADIWTEGAMQASEISGRENGGAIQSESQEATGETTAVVGLFDEPARPEAAHIDRRDWESVADDDLHAFQNDYKFARNWMGAAARTLVYDVDATLPGRRFMNEEGEWGGQKRQTTEQLAYLKDEGKWTWDQIKAGLEKIASYYDNGDIETDMPNSRRIKRIELVLDEMLSEGYTTMDGIEIAPDRGWLEYKKELPGAEAKAIPENAVYGAYEVQFSARSNVEFVEDKYFGRLIERIEEQKQGGYLRVGAIQSGSVLSQVGLPTTGLYFDVSKIRKALEAHEDHLTKAVLKQIPDILRSPVVIAEANQTNTVNVFGDISIGDTPLMVGVVVTKDRAGRNIINKVRTIHARHNYMARITNDRVLYLDKDKKRTRDWFQARGNDVPLGGTQFGFIRSITLSDDVVNPEVQQSARSKSDPDTEELLRIHNEYREAQNDLAESKRKLNELAGHPKYLALIDEISNQKVSRFSPEGRAKTREIRQKTKAIEDELGITALSAKIQELEERVRDLYRQEQDFETNLAQKREAAAIEKSGLTEAEYFRKQAVKEFGYTPDFLDAGYMLPNGKLLNFSGEKGKHFGVRGQDHRAIGVIFENTSGSKALARFMNGGNIRVMAEAPGIDIASSIEPTAQQYTKIKDFVREYADKRFFNVDISDNQGIVIGSLTYNGKLNADKVVNDIKHYYQTGEFREQSRISDFLYSTRDPYAVSDREILANALEYATKNADEKAWLEAYKKDLAELNATQAVLDENRSIIRSLEYRKYQKKETLTKEDTERLEKARVRVKALAKKLDERDKALLKVEAAPQIKAVLERQRETYKERERNAVALVRQRQENAAYRQRIVRKVKKLDELLRNPTDQKHVPDNLKAATLDMLSVFTQDTSVFDKEKLERVRREYAELTNRDSDTSAAGMYDEDTAERIAILADTIGGQRLSRLNRAQLNEVMKVVDHFSHLISNANAVFIEGRRERVDALAEEVAAETQEKGIYMENRANMSALRKLLEQGMVTPAYFFRRLGGAMGRLGNALLNGENRFGVNALKSRETMTGIMQKYHHKAWAGDKRDKLSFVTEEGDVISLTREQALSLYATDKRERSNRLQNASHLRTGGIIIQQGKLELRENRPSNANAAPISSADMEKINAWLTAEQKAYADAMVEYISKDMSELGNETSQALHGYSKFGEGYYFPYRTSSDFRKTNLGDSETALLKSMGFTKSVIRNANTPIIVGDFTETVSEHVAKMLMYNAFAEAQDAFMRVYDHKLTKSRSVKSMIKTAWGKNITDYIEQFMRDVYGGVTRDMTDEFGDKWLSKFKKNAVLANASVTIQQPSALMRAMAYIDPKYFVGAPKAGSFSEAMNYAGTAVIKDIGSFDTNTGRSVAKWMVAEDYQGISEKAKALFTDADYRSDILGAGPEKMDQVAWGIMWDAAKREQAAKTGLDINSEALKEIAGRRFDEVMRLTQVYDSVMARSQVMRSKSVYAKMLTAFMAEPTVTYNMFVDAWFDKQSGGKAKAKRVTRTMAALTGSILLNNLLKSLVAAARDDDDENETYRERYVKNFASNLVSDVNPLNYIPYAKDIMSIFQGYDVERSDISIFRAMYAAMQTMKDDSKSMYERTKSFAVFVGLATGIPFKNVWRDFEAGLNTINTVKEARVLREGWLTHAMEYGAGEVFGKKDTKANSTAELLDAAISGDSRAIDGLREHMSAYNGMDEKEINSALANAIHEALEAGEIDSAQATALLIQYADHDEDEAETKLNKWLYKMDTGNNYSDMKEQFLAGEITEEDAVQARMEYGGVSEEKARKTVSEWQFEKDNDFAYDDMEEAFKDGDITKQQAIEARLDAGADEDDAYWDVTGWEYEKQTGNEWNGRATKLNAAMASGNLTTIEEAITELYDHNTWKNPSSELTGDITAYWKPLYVAATEAERKAMLPLIYDCYELAYTLNGEVYYGDDNVWKKRIKRWESD